MIQHTVK